MIKVYHASTVAVQNPDTEHSLCRRYLKTGMLAAPHLRNPKLSDLLSVSSRSPKHYNLYRSDNPMNQHDEAFHAILEAKYARIIAAISEQYGLSIDKAMSLFYNSETMQLIEEGVADLHCRSDKYLAEEVWLEYQGR